ncbi:MAG: hypothetical protein GXY67_02380 [Clostridiales bacterium]|nr:hypothetical protein [Clostridiales bacterium]
MSKMACWHNSSGLGISLSASLKRLLVLLLVILVLSSGLVAGALAASAGENLAQEAAVLEEQGQYSQAVERYAQAIPLLLDEGNTKLAEACDESSEKLFIIMGTFPYTLEEIKGLIRQTYPDATQEQIALWSSAETLHQWEYEGETHYFSDTIPNLPHRYMDLMYEDTAQQKSYREQVAKVLSIAEAQKGSGGSQYIRPAKYRGIHTLSVPRNELPQTGVLRLWLPIPINTGAQTGVVIESVTPAAWMKLPPSVDQEIGLAYFEVPLAELTDDLFIELSFVFTHHEQHFTVDPDRIGEYDKESALYKQYTAANGNTEITDEIVQMAQKIVGDERNPYFAARKLYDYIVENVIYSFMPHMVFRPRTDVAESDYVHRFQQGDCGAQSMYFTAMCRALGIPARTTGGWQLFTGEFRGHFWAEFYLPNYGWIPVDTSFGQLATYVKDISAQDRAAFIDFCFANQDSMRCVVQKDTDVPLIPPANGTVLLPMAIQMPAVEYSIPSAQLLSIVIEENWTFACEKLDNE